MEKVVQKISRVAEIKLVYKGVSANVDRRLKITGAASAYDLFIRHWNKDTLQLFEQFKIMLLNHDSKVLGICNISSGGLTSTAVDVRLVFAAALKAAATNIILAHNHPSGNTTPSTADWKLTRRLKEIGDLLEIQIKDHIIVTRNSWFSFTSEGLL